MQLSDSFFARKFGISTQDLERYLEERPDAEDATAVESQLSELRQRANSSGD